MRTCTTCNNEMTEGYLAEEFGTRFCSAECLDIEFYVGLAHEIANTPESEEDDMTIFWTTWEEEDEEEPEAPSSGYSIKGHRGTWYVISTDTRNIDNTIKQLFLMEHETYGEEAPHVIIDVDGTIIIQNVHNGFDDLDYCLENDIDPLEN